MCIVAIAWQLFDKMPLVLLSNRDEFFARPTTPAQQWSDAPIFAGRDRQSGGTWLGFQQQPHHDDKTFTQNGRWAAVLNFRDGVQAREDQHSRGELVSHYLLSDLSPMSYARSINLQAYAGFNLIVGDAKQAVVINNRGYPPTSLHSGLHVISNGQPDCEWFKCDRLRGRLCQEVLPLISESLASHNPDISYWQLAAWHVLSDTLIAPRDQLADTGMPEALELALSSICIDTPEMPSYGTRTHSILTMSMLTDKDKQQLQGSPILRLNSREYQRHT